MVNIELLLIAPEVETFIYVLKGWCDRIYLVDASISGYDRIHIRQATLLLGYSGFSAGGAFAV